MEHEVWRFWTTKLDAGLITLLPASDPGSTAVWGSKRINLRPHSCLSDLEWMPFKPWRRRTCSTFILDMNYKNTLRQEYKREIYYDWPTDYSTQPVLYQHNIEIERIVQIASLLVTRKQKCTIKTTPKRKSWKLKKFYSRLHYQTKQLRLVDHY